MTFRVKYYRPGQHRDEAREEFEEREREELVDGFYQDLICNDATVLDDFLESHTFGIRYESFEDFKEALADKMAIAFEQYVNDEFEAEFAPDDEIDRGDV
jgi:hypothetical protein